MTDEKRLEDIRRDYSYPAKLAPPDEYHADVWFLLAHIDAQAKEIERLRGEVETCDTLRNSGLSYCYWRDVGVVKLQAELTDVVQVKESLKRLYDRAATEREELKRTYDKAVERLERETRTSQAGGMAIDAAKLAEETLDQITNPDGDHAQAVIVALIERLKR